MKLSEIGRRLNCQVEGDPNIEITGVAGLEEAVAGQLTFLANRQYRRLIKKTRASAIVVARDAGPMPIAALRSANPYFDFARAIEFFYQAPCYEPDVHPTAIIDPSAQLGAGAHIGPYCFIDRDVQLGRGAVLHSFVTLYRGARIGDDFFAHSHTCVREFCTIGDRVILQNGAIVGGDGFGFARQKDARWFKIRQSGIAVLEDDVEIQANTTVDRATIGETRIGRGAKLDNLVQVGHASKIGEDALLCGQVGLAGSTRVGNRCLLAGQVGAAGHLTIGDDAVISSQSGVPHDVPSRAVYSGYPAIENKRWLKASAIFARLPELQKTIRDFQLQLETLRKPRRRGTHRYSRAAGSGR